MTRRSRERTRPCPSGARALVVVLALLAAAPALSSQSADAAPVQHAVAPPPPHTDAPPQDEGVPPMQPPPQDADAPPMQDEGGGAIGDDGATLDAPPDDADEERPARPPKPWDAPLPSPEQLVADPQAHAELLAAQGVALDLEAGSVSMRGGTIHDAQTLEYPIEFLVVNDWGKAHEALFMVDAWPRTIDTCLRALGATPGDTLRYVELPPDVEPEPDWVVFGARDPQDARRWRAVPPHGTLVDASVHWIDDVGRPHAEPLEALVLDLETEAALEPIGWAFVGGEMLPADEERGDPARFLPDMHGNVMGIVLRAASEAVLERPSLDGIEPYRYVPNTSKAPARGTPVTIVLTLRRG